jgi:hypothetical protein
MLTALKLRRQSGQCRFIDRGDTMLRTTLTMMATAALGSLLMFPAAAHAEPRPYDCSSGQSLPSKIITWARCTGGSGMVAAIAYCSNNTTKVGVWVPVGQYSNAKCEQYGTWVVGHSYTTSYG